MNEKKYPNKDTNKLRSVGECRNIDRLAVHMALPKESSLILDMSAAPMDGSAHPADTRRWQKAVLAAGNSILDKAVAEKRGLNDFEESAFESCQRLYDLAEHSINLSEINNRSSNDNNAHLTPGIFGKGEPVKFRNSAHGNDLGGVTIGGVMRAMVTGIKTPEISNALSEGTNSAGGFSVPDIMMAPFIDLMRNKSVCFQAGAQTLALESDITSMCRIATDPTATWRVENDAIAISDPTFESVIFAPKSLAVIVKVSRELLMDSVNIEEMLQTSLSGAIALEMDRVALNGTGSNPQPKGITVAANVNSVSMGVNGAAMTNYANLLAALQLQEEANAARPTAMVMAPRSLYKLAGLMDTTNQPLRPPPTVEGIQMLPTNSMPINETQGTSTDCSKVIVGDFTKLVFGIRFGMRIEILNQTYAENYQVAFLAHVRVDTQLLSPKNFCKIIGVR